MEAPAARQQRVASASVVRAQLHPLLEKHVPGEAGDHAHQARVVVWPRVP
jgi:hypothetical protein